MSSHVAKVRGPLVEAGSPPVLQMPRSRGEWVLACLFPAPTTAASGNNTALGEITAPPNTQARGPKLSLLGQLPGFSGVPGFGWWCPFYPLHTDAAVTGWLPFLGRLVFDPSVAAPLQ